MDDQWLGMTVMQTTDVCGQRALGKRCKDRPLRVVRKYETICAQVNFHKSPPLWRRFIIISLARWLTLWMLVNLQSFSACSWIKWESCQDRSYAKPHQHGLTLTRLVYHTLIAIAECLTRGQQQCSAPSVGTFQGKSVVTWQSADRIPLDLFS